MFHWMLMAPPALKSVLPVEDPFLIWKCALVVVSAHISLQVKHLTQVCEGEKQSQLLPTTSPLWFRRRISIVHFRDKFLSFLCSGTSCFKHDFSSPCEKEPFHISTNIPAFFSVCWLARRPRDRYRCLQWWCQPSHLLCFSMIHLDVRLLLQC